MELPKKQPKIIFSFNTFPIRNSPYNLMNRFHDIIYMMSLSVLYCCKWYNEVEVYVDNLAYEYLKELPCNVKLTVFENDPVLWMKSKIEIIQKQKEPFIHVDNDVFFKEKLDLSFDTVFLERQDVAKYNYNVLISFFENYKAELNYWNSEVELIPSCGLLGFANMNLKNDFVKAFYSFEKIYKKYHNEYDSFISKVNKIGDHPELCLLLEQYNLGCLLQEKKITPKLLLEGKTEAEQSQFANKIGFTHLYGTSKFSKRNIKRIHYLFETNFPSYYKIIAKKVSQQNKAISNQFLNEKNSI